MIDQDVFNIEWAVICERCNRDPSQVLAARYYQSLSPRMTTDEFRVAARVVFEECEFLPPVAAFIGGDPAERGSGGAGAVGALRARDGWLEAGAHADEPHGEAHGAAARRHRQAQKHEAR